MLAYESRSLNGVTSVSAHNLGLLPQGAQMGHSLYGELQYEVTVNNKAFIVGGTLRA